MPSKLVILSIAVVLSAPGCAFLRRGPQGGPDPEMMRAKLDTEVGRFEPPTLEKKLREGDRQRDMGQTDRAVWTYLEAHRLEPDDPRPRIRMAFLHLHAEPERSVAIFESLLRDHPKSVQALTGLGAAMLALDRAEKAIPPLQRALELAPDAAGAHSTLGIAYDRTGSLAPAIEHLTRTVELRPQDSVALNNLAVTYLLNGQLTQAEQTLRRALLISPGDPRLSNALGIVLARQQRFQEALDEFRNGGSEQLALNNVGYMYFLNGDFEHAIFHYEKALLVGGDKSEDVIENIRTARAAQHSVSARSRDEETPGAEPR